jgi:outer membrane autotransporter protein
MKTTHRRIALLTGASVAALSAAPAFAAPHDVAGTGTYAGTNTSTATVTICDIAGADPSCFFGVYNTGAAAVAVAVNTAANGQIFQHDGGGDITLTMINATGDSAEVGGIAVASTNADARLDFPVRQTGTGSAVSLYFENDGALLVDAVASATGGAATADADATVYAGINQYAHLATSAHVSLVNNGTLTVAATAVATATNFASASASVDYGIAQTASATGPASAALTNNGTLNIAANASAAAEDASAYAYIENGIGQYVNGSIATASVTNATSAVIDMGAHASAVGTTYASASASISNAIEQYVTGSTSALGSIVNLGVLNIHATAAAAATEASAYAYIDSAINQNVSATGAAVGVVVNSATMNVSASASAVASTYASASASISDVVVQNVSGGTFAEADFANSGAFNVAANAVVSAGTEGSAYAYIFDVVTQNVTAGVGGTAVGSAVNSGTIALTASASAVGTSAYATAEIWGGIRQDVNGGAVAVANASNSGLISLIANAHASGTTSASADASAGSAITQEVSATGGGTASAIAVNSGTIAMSASAVANATVAGSADAFAEAYGAVSQNANAAGGIANLSLTNSGVISEHAVASANGGSSAEADAYAYTALYQFGTGATVNATLSNAGSITNIATAIAVAGNDAVVDTADASASAYGIGQHLHGSSVNAVLTNSGSIDIEAFASATGQENVDADAYVTAVYQTLHGTVANNASFTNSGSITAVAGAHAITTSTGPFVTATSDSASATAIGYGVYGGAGVEVVTAVNSGAIVASASASAPNFAYASAVAMNLSGLTGTVSASNAGTISANASVSGTTSSAYAIGIDVSGNGTQTVTNSGAINVAAINAGNGVAESTGIRITNAGGDVTTVTNDGGTIIAMQSVDGGASFQRGMAIDLAGSLNANTVNLLGDGNIYGNIDVNVGDEINVASGTTYFDGVINPEFVPAGGFTTADLDTGIFGEGTLNIGADGNLILADPQVTGDPTMYDGPAYAIVDTLNLAADGTLTFELQPLAGGDQPVGTYPQVYADTANLDGTIVARLRPPSGLLADSYFWDNVIDANVRTGDPTCVLDSVYASSPLITGAFGGDICNLDANANVDLGIERVAFNALGGLTRNQLAVATAIENAYSVDLTGDYGALVAELFLLDENNLVAAYDQLSGVEYPNYLHAVRNNTFAINSVVSDQIDCPTTLGSVAACATPTYRGRVWISGAYNTVNVDSDANAIGYDADNWNVMVGGDYNFGLASVGAFAGYRNIKVDYPDAIVGSGIDSDGFQAGIYGGIDTGRFYARLIGSYSSLQGDSERRISIGSISAIAKGQPDVDVWSVYGEAGARFDLGSSWLTPYVALDYTSMHLKDFHENGGLGANLDIDAQTVDQTSGLIGLKWAGNLGGITPEAKIAYRHDFQNDLGVDMGFAGVSAATFTKVEDYSEDSIVAGLNFTGHFGTNFTGRLGYQGRFNSDVSDHTIYGTLTYLFGAAPPPPPPPPVEAPPPPPAPPATQVCPDGTTILATESCPVPPPPPPPPPPAPERG